MKIQHLILTILAAITIVGCGGDPLPADDCIPGVCPGGKTECSDADRLPSYCPGQAPELTPSPDAGAVR